MGCGTVRERPWGLTLASFAEARAHGQLTLTGDDGKLYGVAFADGVIVGASSPFASDSAARVALTSHLVRSAEVPTLVRAVAAAPGRDEVDVVSERAGLTGQQTERLRRRLLVQRVARTFGFRTDDPRKGRRTNRQSHGRGPGNRRGDGQRGK